MRSHIPWTVWLLAQFALPIAVCGQEQEDAEKEQFQRWLKYYAEVAAEYDIRLASDKQTKLQVTPEPVMSYSHPSSQTGTHGAFFLWTRGGRPEVIASIWSEEVGNGRRSVVHEFHSLATEPLAPVRIGGRTWAPESGIELTSIPDAPPPRATAALRLAQMRTLAQQFTGYSTPHGTELRLRTLRQPLYRYESELPDVIDGAVFGMFKDWDPEIMLLIEARQASDEFVWHYGVGRFNTCPMRLEYAGADVWEGHTGPGQLAGRRGSSRHVLFCPSRRCA